MLYINNTKYICYAIPCLFVQSHGLKIFSEPTHYNNEEDNFFRNW